MGGHIATLERAGEPELLDPTGDSPAPLRVAIRRRRRRVLPVVAILAIATVLSVLLIDGTLKPPTGDSAGAAGKSQFTVVNGAIRKATGTPVPADGTQAALWSNHSVATTTLTGSGQLVLGAIGQDCKGMPTVRVTADGRLLGELTLTSTTAYGAHLVGPALASGSHTIAIAMVNDLYLPPSCDRNAYLASAQLASPSGPAPTAMPTGAPIPTIGPLPTASSKPTAPAPAPSNSSSAPAPRPPAGGAPGPDNTGVPAGTKLTVHQGDLTVTKDDTVIDSVDIHGFLIIQASRVTVRNSMIRGTYAPGPAGKALVADYGDNTGFVIEDSTLRPDKPSAYVDGLKGRNFTARRLDISNTVDTAQIFGGTSTTIEDSWLHDLAYFSPYKLQPDNQTHNDGVQIEGGQNILLQNNTIERAHNSAIMVTQNYARTSNVQVVSNRLSGGNVCTVNLSEKGKGPIVGFALRGNTFGPDLGQNGCAVIAPTSSPVTMVDNVLLSGGVVTVRKGA